MDYTFKSRLDEIATELKGMACIMYDDSNYNQAQKLNEFSKELIDISNQTRPLANCCCSCGATEDNNEKKTILDKD